MKKYIPSELESKWQRRWEESGIYKIDLSKPDKKYYLLVEFTYPSGDLHMGHWFAFAVPDILARMKRMQGYNVFAPNGFDAFGLPAENAAIKRGIHPQDWTLENIKKMKEQFATMGAIYDWEHEVITCMPNYYKWNQWIFLKMFEKGLAYRGKTLSNWCPVDQSVLANENVENGKCWRCGTEVVQKEVEQWFFKITDFAEELLWPESSDRSFRGSTPNAQTETLGVEPQSTRQVDWPKSLKDGQNNWIGKSEGIEIDFPIAGSDKEKITVFTKFPETIFGVTYMVLAPEHDLIGTLTTKEHRNEVVEYIKASQKKSELERISLEKEKTGVFTGSYCVNPVNYQKVPIWVADYVIASYGTGAVMGVPGSDTRDFAFAKKFNLPIIKVIAKDKGDLSEIKTDKDVLEEGFIVNSGEFDGLSAPQLAKAKFMEYLEAKGWGKKRVNYHLHDWSVSRQRYWGTPIPIIYCDNCGTVPVPFDQVPVELPYEVDYAPKGKPPLATAEEWVNVKCPECGRNAKRETETMDTFVDSSWYFLRYLDPKNHKEIASKKLLNDWMPVDIYFGGAEHTLGHTLYSRFFVKFLKKIGVLDFREYAKKRVHHGVILGPDGSRMSKSRGNVVNPDDEVKKFGSDSVRMYLAFLGPYDLVAPWNPTGINGVYHFLQRVWALADYVEISRGPVSSFPPASAPQPFLSKIKNPKLETESEKGWVRAVGSPSRTATPRNLSDISLVPRNVPISSALSEADLQMMHKTIKKVTEDIENIKFNTAVSSLMEWLNYLSQKAHRVNSASVIASEAKQSSNEIASDSSNPRNDNKGVSQEEYETLLLLLAPFAPHITEELWSQVHADPRKSAMNQWQSIHQQPCPKYDPKLAQFKKITLVIQVNGKLRDRLPVEAGTSQKDAEQLALSSQKVQKFVGGKKPRKVIFVADRLINFVV